MMKSIVLVSLIFSVFLGQLTADVSIIIKERNGISRRDEPVTLGVPLGRGELYSAAKVHITNGSGTPVNSQFKTMATWDNGSIKWLKCDFQATVGANATATYWLKTNASHTANTELAVVQDGSSITVTTGPLKFTVNKSSFNIIDEAFLDLNGNRQYDFSERVISEGQSTGPVVTAGAVDYRAKSKAPEKIEVEEQGPMKVVIKVSGRHYNGGSYLLKYETRIYAYAGKPYVKLYHVYANGKSVDSLNDPLASVNNANFDRYALDFKLNLTGGKTARFGGANNTAATVNIGSGQTASLLQRDRVGTGTAMQYSVKHGNSTVSTGSKAAGWGTLYDGKWGVTVASRFFWQKYPKGILFNDNGTVSLQPAPTKERLYIAMGTGDEMIIYFHSAADASFAGAKANGLNQLPLLARASAQQYSSSNAFYALSAGQPSIEQMNGYIHQVTDDHFFNVADLGVYGNINFGDTPVDYWYFDASEVDGTLWGSNYYDCNVLTPIRLFVQEGDLKYSDIFIPGALHFMETACWNPYDTTSWLSGFSPAYSTYHRASSHFEQHYNEGTWYYYYLTGDERAREIGLRGAKAIKDEQWWGNDNVNCRMAYQRGAAVLEAYKNTQDTTYLNHAKHLLVTKILNTQDKYGLIGSTDENGGVDGEQTFMMALYSDTLWKYIQELPVGSSERQTLSAKLAKLADCIHQYARKAPGQEEYWNYFPKPSDAAPPVPEKLEDDPDATVYWWGKGLVAGTYAYAYHLTGQAKYKTLAQNLLTSMWKASNIDWGGMDFWQKTTGQVMKNMIHATAIINGGSPPPPPPPPPAAPVIGVDVTSLNFNAVITDVLDTSGRINISNTGGGTLNWSISGIEGWLTVSPASGTDSGMVSVSADATGLTAGTYTGELSISDVNASNSPVTVTVTFVVTEPPPPSEPPKIGINRSAFNFSAIVSGPSAAEGMIYINNTGKGTLNWNISSDSAWLTTNKGSGTNSGFSRITASPASLPVGTHTAKLTISDPDAENSPLYVTVTLKVYLLGQTGLPFGIFATPLDNSTVSSSIPVTGWALDDVGIDSVKLYNGNDYIGDAVFIEGARPDIEGVYPDYPMNSRAGWGYMLLTNFLPGGGNGTYVINASATDKEGNTVSLGSKTITCDNTNAVKPFGAIDTPGQGGDASGGKFINWGWVLTPQPNLIPTDGSTISIIIDGVAVGKPNYNIYRSDIADLFPGYANSNAAIGYYFIDTTKYHNGIHTIQWTAIDSGGNTDGIGSRYFNIRNSGNNPDSLNEAMISNLSGIPTKKPVIYSKGMSHRRQFTRQIQNSEFNAVTLDETERLTVFLVDNLDNGSRNNSRRYYGAQVVGEHFRPLPVGSTLDTEKGIFFWQPGPGFLGDYLLVFVVKEENGPTYKINLKVTIKPG